MKKITAVLLDTISIQKYIFASNKLKENLGASHIVASIYKEELEAALKDTLGYKPEINQWKETPAQVHIKDNNETCYETGFIGGGNALLFFRGRERAKEFIKNWTRRLLLCAPGLSTSVALNDFDFNNFRKSMKDLYEQLTKNKNKYFPNTVLAKHGITADCHLSGFTREIYHQKEGYISGVVFAKLKAAEKSQVWIKDQFRDILNEKFIFTNEIDKLGQLEGKSHLAIIHIDGNAFGKKFKECQDIVQRRTLSNSIEEATNNAFACLLEDIIGNIDKFKNAGLFIQTDNSKKILPIRPIVLNGDDVTFITDGRLGLYLAEKFVQYWTRNLLFERPFTASAGVAIVKTKFPFYRGYQMAEELCASAKKSARRRQAEWDKETSWLDFYIAYGGKAGSLTEIRKRYFTVNQGQLYFSPYLLDRQYEQDEKNITYLKKGIQALRGGSKWPRSKLKELREILPLGEGASSKFIKEMNARGLHLPQVSGSYHINGWENASTPYFNMIELIDFYPDVLLSEEKERE